MSNEPIQHNRNIAKQLIVSTLMFSTFITILTSAYQLYGNYKRDVRAIYTHLQEIEDVHLPSLSALLWTADLNELKNHLQGLHNLSDMQYLEITEDGDSLARIGTQHSVDVITRDYPIFYNYKNKPLRIGTLHTEATLKNVYQRIFDQILDIIVSNAIKTFLVTGFILYLFHYLVTRHLHKMAVFAQQLNISSLDHELKLERKQNKRKGLDELDILTQAFSTMQMNLQKSINDLRESQERYKQLVESTTAIPWELDLKTWRFTYVGPQATTILGYSIEEWRRENFWSDTIYEEDRDHTVEYCKIATMDGKDHEIEYRMMTASGDVIWIRDYVHVIFKNNKPALLQGFMFDITERKQAEAELANYRDHLEELVMQRTQELELSNRDLESYSYSIAHDLRAPLRSITSFSQILQKEAKSKLNELETDSLNRVINAAKRLARLIDDILNLARVSKSKLKCESVSISNTARKITQELESTYAPLKVVWQIQDNLLVKADINLLELALYNLFDNALKYSSHGETAKVEFSAQEQHGEMVYFVRDNGVGFDTHFVNKLFVPFERLHSHSEFEGTGIGLATVQRIIERHGGRVWADSILGEGSTFYFTLK